MNDTCTVYYMRLCFAAKNLCFWRDSLDRGYQVFWWLLEVDVIFSAWSIESWKDLGTRFFTTFFLFLCLIQRGITVVNPHPDSRWRKKQPMELQKLDKVHRVRWYNSRRGCVWQEFLQDYQLIINNCGLFGRGKWAETCSDILLCSFFICIYSRRKNQPGLEVGNSCAPPTLSVFISSLTCTCTCICFSLLGILE